MFPGSFIWNRISEEWLVSKRASALFALSSASIAICTMLGLYFPPQDPVSLFANILWGILGVATGLSILFLWGGMWSYWIRCDSSSKWTRRFWFLVLLAGFWYGAIVYFAFVYLPSRTRVPRSDRPDRDRQTSRGPLEIGIWGRALIAAWAALFLFVALCFVFPKPFARILHPIAPYIQLIPIPLIILTWTYWIARMYRAGMKRSRNST
jgi:hypothetical protein